MTDQLNTYSLSSNGAPLVSIGLPTFNGEKRIVSTLASILSQGYPNLEVIISDNCSSDNTEEVCAELSKKYSSIRYFRQKENIGIMPNFQFVLGKASGDLFMWISDDDTLEPGILLKYVDFLSTHSDYSIVSGEIRYWLNNKPAFIEWGFSLENNLRIRRVIRYYARVVHGATFYGLMPRPLAKKFLLRNRMGEDWHLVAKAAYLGKIKMLECIGYNKKLNGASRNLQHYAKLIGASWFATYFPHAQIAIDAFYDILTSPIYKESPLILRLSLASFSSMSIFFNHYCWEYPFIIGGKIKRFLGFKRKLRTPNSVKNGIGLVMGLIIS